jgi:AcrR family transcriptional regulator
LYLVVRLEYHEAMTVSRQGDLRANQKARTRGALVDAALELMRTGTPPTVADAAERARVSRATAYRYFPTQDALLVEISDIGPSVEPVEEMLTGLSTDDVGERLERLLATLNPIALAEEAAMRAALRVYLDTWFENQRRGDDTPVRAGRRMEWLDDVLEPARRRLSPERYERVRAALALTMSIDAIVVMKDVCHLGDDATLDTLQWAAAALLRAATTDESD